MKKKLSKKGKIFIAVISLIAIAIIFVLAFRFIPNNWDKSNTNNETSNVVIYTNEYSSNDAKFDITVNFPTKYKNDASILPVTNSSHEKSYYEFDLCQKVDNVDHPFIRYYIFLESDWIEFTNEERNKYQAVSWLAGDESKIYVICYEHLSIDWLGHQDEKIINKYHELFANFYLFTNSINISYEEPEYEPVITVFEDENAIETETPEIESEIIEQENNSDTTETETETETEI